MQLDEAIGQFIGYLTTQKRSSHNTVLAYQADIQQFRNFCAQEGIDLPSVVGASSGRFVLFLKKQYPLSARSIARKLACLRAFFRFLTDRGYGVPPAVSVIVPKQRTTIPKVLSHERIQRLIEHIKTASRAQDMRNRVMFYLLYATGMRVSELCQLRVSDVHLDEQLLRIHGKGSKERLVPLGAGLTNLLRSYLNEIRALDERVAYSDFVFGVRCKKVVRAISRQTVWRLLHRWGTVIGCRVTPHMLRHTMATHLLHNGADLRSVQVLLGHEQVTTTQIYTHVDVHQLRAVYDKVHHRR